MTDQKTIHAADAAERYDNQLRELAEQPADGGEETDQNPQEVQAWRTGAEWVVDEYGEDAVVRVEALRTGAFGLVEDHATDARIEKLQSGGPTANEGAGRVFYVARGVVDAPFYDDGITDYKDRVATVRGLPIEAAKWLEHEIEEVTSIDPGNSKSFADYLAETSSQDQTETASESPDSSGETPPE